MMNSHDIDSELVRETFIYESGQLYWRQTRRGAKAGDLAGCTMPNGYVQIMLNYKKYLAHRLIWAYHHDSVPDCLDHIDGNPGNNLLENLRAASQTQNQGNRGKSKNKSSKWKGVHWCKVQQRWVACIHIPTRKSNPRIGSFMQEDDAARAYNKHALDYFGEFAKLNDVAPLLPLPQEDKR